MRINRVDVRGKKHCNKTDASSSFDIKVRLKFPNSSTYNIIIKGDFHILCKFTFLHNL